MLDHIQTLSFKWRRRSSAFLQPAFHEVRKCVRQKMLNSWRPPSAVCEWLADWVTGATGPSVQPAKLPELSLLAPLIRRAHCQSFSNHLTSITICSSTSNQTDEIWHWAQSTTCSMHKSSWIITDSISRRGCSKVSTRQVIMDCLPTVGWSNSLTFLKNLVAATALAAVTQWSHLCYRAMEAMQQRAKC